MPKTTNLKLWLAKEDSPPPDIYAVALQELVDLNAGSIVFNATGKKWNKYNY